MAVCARQWMYSLCPRLVELGASLRSEGRVQIAL
jgi:hypothetical protein